MTIEGNIVTMTKGGRPKRMPTGCQQGGREILG